MAFFLLFCNIIPLVSKGEERTSKRSHSFEKEEFIYRLFKSGGFFFFRLFPSWVYSWFYESPIRIFEVGVYWDHSKSEWFSSIKSLMPLFRLNSQIQSFSNQRLFFFLGKNVITQYICECILRSATQENFFKMVFCHRQIRPDGRSSDRLWRKGGFNFNFNLRWQTPIFLLTEMCDFNIIYI